MVGWGDWTWSDMEAYEADRTRKSGVEVHGRGKLTDSLNRIRVDS
jgi:hypothetical protein